MANPVAWTTGIGKPNPPCYRAANWPMYNRALARRRSMLILRHLETQWYAEAPGKIGRSAVFSDTAIQLCLSVKVLFNLPLSQTVGMVRALRKLAGLDWPVPDYSKLCRRQETLAVQFPCRRAVGPLNLLTDSTGMKFLGDGEWLARNTILRGVRADGRAGWKRQNGYHARSRAGAKMRCLKAFGERIAARDPDRRPAEIHIRVALISRFYALGTAEIVRLA